MSLKRTFIPPSHRPYVRGSRLSSLERPDFHKTKSVFESRLFLQKIIQGEIQSQPDFDAAWAREVLHEFFPHFVQGMGGKTHV